ncbi:MAG: hypothetical protein JRN43_03950 [Nitrososphaerota archaeon]|nr:hypothetical protein [Nitrososphaerota archaeon]MDG7019452.1 hypothetical protein [Nitrososphaerota archaeon]
MSTVPPPHKRAWYAVAFGMAVLLPAALVPSPGATLTLAIFYLLPAAIWFVVGRTLVGPRYLRLVLPHSTHAAMRRLIPWGKGRPDEVRYFTSAPGGVHVGRRVATVFLASLGLAALFLPFFVPAYTDSGVANYIFTQHVYVDLVFLMLAALFLLPFLLFPAWVFEDLGLRHHTRREETVRVPGSGLKDLVVGFGILLSVIGMLPMFQHDPTLPSDFVITLFVTGVLSVPLAFTSTVVFVYSVEPRLMSKLVKDDTFGRFGAGTVSVSGRVSGKPPGPAPQGSSGNA